MRVRQEGGLQGLWGLQNKFEQKSKGGQGKLFFIFSITFVRITFFSNGRVRQEGGMIQAN